MSQKLSNHFEQLSNEITKIESTKADYNSDYSSYTFVDDELLLKWKVQVKNLLNITCGKGSLHSQEFIDAEKSDGTESNYDVFKRLKSVFAATFEDFKGGFLTSIKNLIQADIFESELEQAEELLNNKYKLASAVIAGVVLETALRDLCSREGLIHSKLDKMNADLAKAGVYNKLQQKRITALAEIRNKAAHGRPAEFTDEDVRIMIRDIEQFLATQLA